MIFGPPFLELLILHRTSKLNNKFMHTLNSKYFILCGPRGKTEVVSFPDDASGKESTCQCRRHRSHGFDHWVRKIPWRRKWQPTPVFLPRESHGQRSLVGYSPWGCKESDMTEATLHTCRKLRCAQIPLI